MREDPMPSAPASISFRTSSRIWASCSVVAFLSSRPITYSRIVVAPMEEATVHEMPIFFQIPQIFGEGRPLNLKFQIALGCLSPAFHFVSQGTHRIALAEDFGGHSLFDVAQAARVDDQ